MPFASCHHLTVLPLVVYALIALSASAAENAALPATWTDFRTHLQSLGYGAAAGRLPKAPPKPSDSCVSTVRSQKSRRICCFCNYEKKAMLLIQAHSAQY